MMQYSWIIKLNFLMTIKEPVIVLSVVAFAVQTKKNCFKIVYRRSSEFMNRNIWNFMTFPNRAKERNKTPQIFDWCVNELSMIFILYVLTKCTFHYLKQLQCVVAVANVKAFDILSKMNDNKVLATIQQINCQYCMNDLSERIASDVYDKRERRFARCRRPLNAILFGVNSS